VNPRILRTIIGIAVIIAAFCVFGAATVPAKDVVAIRMPGRYYSEPATVRIMIAVEPNADNRKLLVEADGESYFRSSELTLDGDKGQRLHTVEFRNLPAGEYYIRAAVLSNADVRGTAQQVLTVGVPGEFQH
jgi:hypothetical protein